MGQSTRQLARLAGLLYLVVAITGGFAQMVARLGVLVPGDAAATADNIRDSATLFQIGLVADIVNIVAFVGVALLLYAVLSPVHRLLSGTFVVLVAIAAAIMAADLVNHAGALVVATQPSVAAAMGAHAADALAALFLDLHNVGYLVAQVFFGLWLLPLGYVAYRSGYFPRALGILLMIGSLSYLASFGVTIASSDFTSSLRTVFALPAGFAEIAFLAWLLVRGANVDTPRRPSRAGSPAITKGATA